MDPDAARYLPTLLFVIASAASMLVIGLGIILSYHWFRYSMSRTTPLVAFCVYSIVSLLLIAGLFMAAMALRSL